MPQMKMRKYLLATALVGLGSAPTIAADLAARPYTKAPALAAVYDWTGFYIGVNAGVGLGRDRFQHDWLGEEGIYSFYTSPQGGFGGGQIGYNWQTGSMLGPIVLGVEADIQGAGLSDDRTNFVIGTSKTTYGQKLDWFGTARGRIGIANGPVLSYVTAGYAVGNVKTNATQAAAPFAAAFSTERTQSGWVVGSGVEAALGGNWTGKIEYLYLNLGNKTDISTLLVPTPINTEIRENIFRVGLNYRIGGKAYAPVVAANWAGFYLGGNFGSGTGRDRSSLNLPAAGIVETFNLAPDGINGGVQAGYNWQAANWVFGLEADIQGSTQKDDKTCVVFCLPSSIPGGVRAAYDATLPWFGTVRGRLGYTITPTLLVYGTGGFAYGGAEVSSSVNTTPGCPGFCGGLTSSSTLTGWAAGGGLEYMISPNWTAKLEYWHYDLGSLSQTFGDSFGRFPGTFVNTSTNFKGDIVRIGANYKF